MRRLLVSSDEAATGCGAWRWIPSGPRTVTCTECALSLPRSIAPDCTGQICRREVIRADPATRPTLVLAGGEPPIVVDSWWRWFWG